MNAVVQDLYDRISMDDNRSVARHLTISALTAACQIEARNFRHGESSNQAFAFELLERAIQGGDYLAWDAFMGQYSSLVLTQIRRHPAHAATAEDDSFWLNRTFQRFAGAVGNNRLDQFSSLAAVLQYLKACALSVLLDEVRARRSWQQISFEALPNDVEAGVDIEQSVTAKIAAEQLWAAIVQELPDESEQLVARLSFKYGYKPAEIHARYTDRFSDIEDVYRTKRKLLERLRHSSRLQRFLCEDG